MAIIISFEEYVRTKGKSKQHEELKSISSEFGRIVYFNKREVIEQ